MKRILAALAGLVLAGSGAFAAETLPGGATTLTETHDDWVVRCQVANKLVQCAAQQEQLATDTRQRVIAIEFAPSAENLAGTIAMPFGLLLANGAIIQVDDKPASPAIAFKTCLPAGCIVPLLLGKDWADAMRAGQALAVKSTAVDGQEAKFSISLKGFGSALDRINELTK